MSFSILEFSTVSTYHCPNEKNSIKSYSFGGSGMVSQPSAESGTGDVCLPAHGCQTSHCRAFLLLCLPRTPPCRSVHPWGLFGLTGIGICHHGGQVPALAQVHGHVGRVLADDVTGFAGVHGIHVVATAGPCGGRSWGRCADAKFCLTRKLWKLKGRLDQWSPSLGFNNALKSRGCQCAN